MAWGALALLALTACGDSGPADYFPVDASHNWQYRVYITDGNSQITAAANMSFLAPRDFNGATVYPQKADVDMPNQPTKTTFAFFVIYQNAVCQNGEQAAGADPTAADPATHCVLKFPLVKDASWTTAADKILTHGNDIMLTMRVVATDETVTVPAGTYYHCIETAAVADQIIQYPGMWQQVQANLHITEEGWYAPGVGLIKGTETAAVSNAGGATLISPGDANRQLSMELAAFK